MQAAELLGHHKSWVNRRLALLERLCDEARGELRLGLLAPSLARQLARLPVGNQTAALTAAEVRGVIDARTRRSTALVTNIDFDAFDAWGDYLGDPPLAMAFLDRVVDGAIILKIKGKSYRARRAGKKPDQAPRN